LVDDGAAVVGAGVVAAGAGTAATGAGAGAAGVGAGAARGARTGVALVATRGAARAGAARVIGEGDACASG